MATYKFGSATPENWTKEHTNRNPVRVDDRWEAFGADYDETNDRVVFCAPVGLWGNTNNTGTLFHVNQDNNNISIDIDTEATSADGINISAAVMTVGTIVDIPDADALSTGKALNIVSNSSATGTRSLVYLKNDHTSATGATVLEIAQDAAVAPLLLTVNATVPAIKIGGSGTYMQTGVGASGTATAVPSNPTYYLQVTLSGTDYVIPAFAAS